MPHITQESPVGQIVAESPHLSRVFERLHIDYCCGGKKSLGDACRERQLDPGDVLDRLEKAGRTGADAAADPIWLNRSLSDLCDHIERTHHAYLRDELPRLTGLIEKVVNAHAERHPELREIQQEFGALRSELEPHMMKEEQVLFMKEEQVLFPAIRRIERSQQAAAFPFGSVANPIECMLHEHDAAGSALDQLRRLTGGYEPPEGACSTYRAMLDGLDQLERDMHEHVHKENNILFPRAIELESATA